MSKRSSEMLVSNNLLRTFPRRQALFWSTRHVYKILALNFSISTSKIQLAEAPSLNSDPPYSGSLLQGEFDTNKSSGVGTDFGLLVHVLPGPNKWRVWKQNIDLR
jgi:hypothetical protein